MTEKEVQKMYKRRREVIEELDNACFWTTLAIEDFAEAFELAYANMILDSDIVTDVLDAQIIE